MRYSEEEIKRYLGILNNYTKKTVAAPSEVSIKSKCINCQRDDCFSIYLGHKICKSCCCLNGHVLGYYDKKDYDRLHYRKKSIYQRKYHYEKKVIQVTKTLKLTEDQKYELYKKLMTIDN